MLDEDSAADEVLTIEEQSAETLRATEGTSSGGGLDAESPLVTSPESASDVEESEADFADKSLLYDSESPQRFPVLLPVEDELYEVTLIGVVRDIHLRQYATKVGRVMKAETEEAEQTAATSNAFLELFDKTMQDIEGFEDEKPEDWRDIFSPQHKSTILREMVFGLYPIEPRIAKKKPLRWSANLKNVTTRMRVPFDGREIVTTHVLEKADAKLYGEFTSFLGDLSFRGSDAHMIKMADWYDGLYVSHSGYKNSIPIHHKSAAAMQHLIFQGRALRKN